MAEENTLMPFPSASALSEGKRISQMTMLITVMLSTYPHELASSKK